MTLIVYEWKLVAIYTMLSIADIDDKRSRFLIYRDNPSSICFWLIHLSNDYKATN